MKRYTYIFILLWMTLPAFAGFRTYTFTSSSWASKVVSGPCDGTSDGWISNLAATDYSAGYYDAQDRLYSAGVGVKTGSSGAGAVSILAFDSITAITVNFCQNSSKGKGVIYFQVGTNPYDSLIVARPLTSGAGVYNRDSVVMLHDTLSGNVRFWVNCTENGIYIHSLTIHCRNVEGGELYDAVFRRVTDVSQLADGDDVIFAVPDDGVFMGYFDEYESQNNIKAISGTFSRDYSTCVGKWEAIYTLYKDEVNGDSVFYFSDELRYEEAYLVASGGQTKNRLAVWNHLYDANTYGYYGYWTITIDSVTTIHNIGNSLGSYLQYNWQNGTRLFACYPSMGHTAYLKPVTLYRLSLEPVIATAVGNVMDRPADDLSASRPVKILHNGHIYLRLGLKLIPL